MEYAKPHPGLAAVFSFIFNGLGQIYNGQIKKGLLIIFLSSLSMFILIVGAVLIAYWVLGRLTLAGTLMLGSVLFAVGLVLICIVGIYSIYDAYYTAQKLN